MKRIWDHILFKKELRFGASCDQINALISNMDQDDFGIIELEDRTFQFLSNISLGTGIVYGHPFLFKGIHLYGDIIPETDSITRIRFHSKLRIELKLIAMLWLISIGIQLLGFIEMPLWIILLLFPVFIFWFGQWYRIQEESLFIHVKKKINRALKGQA